MRFGRFGRTGAGRISGASGMLAAVAVHGKFRSETENAGYCKVM